MSYMSRILDPRGRAAIVLEAKNRMKDVDVDIFIGTGISA